MSRAETSVLDESTPAQLVAPIPGKYVVKSTGAPKQVPLGADFDIEGDLVSINQVPKGPAYPLPNGDFQVDYTENGYALSLQFRQSGPMGEYLFGVSMPAKSAEPGVMDDPPVTGVFGAESRPPGDEG